MKYTILFTKMLFISCLAMVLGFAMTGCSDDDNELQAGYGYAQFKLYKSASYKGGEAKDTRAGINELEHLRDAQKMKIVLLNNEDGTEVSQTVGLDATNDADAEFGLRSEKMQLLAGSYTVVGYYLYKIAGQELEPILSGEPEETTVIKIVDGGLTVQDFTVNVVKRGGVTFTLKKDISTRAAAGDGAYLFEDIRYVDVTVKHEFLSQSTIKFSKLPVVYKEKAENKDGKVYGYAVSVSDSVLSLRAGKYSIVSYATYDRSEKQIEINVGSVAQNSFEVVDNETTEAFVPVYLKETSAKLKDYMALKAIWEALDGPNWKYSGMNYPTGTNWNFDKEMDMWGNQPGVDLDSQGRVTVLNIGSFGAKGDVPAEIGQLSELKILTLGTHSDQLGDNIFEKVNGEITDAQKEVMRADYYNKFIKKDLRASFSEPLQLAFKLQGHEVQPTIKTRNGISPKDISPGNITNGIKSLPAEIRKLTKLQQLYIANGHFTTLPAEVRYLTACTDVEIYNCPKMTTFPDALTTMPNVEVLNMANNPQIPSDEIFRGLVKLADGASKEKLQILYLGNNKLKELPENFKNFKKLGKLDCNNNQITKIYPLGKSVNLVQLTMDHNLIEEIPVDAEGYYCGYEDVETFSFSYNKLKVMPNIFNAKSAFVMSSVDFSSNEITRIAGEDDGTYRGINASTVSLGNNKLTKFPAILISTDSPITSLNLSGNGISEFPDGSLKGKNAYLLQSLDLTYNKLTKLPKEFNATTLPYLYGIDMSNNRFDKFPTGPLNIDHLTVFGLRKQRDESGNRTISDWPTGIYQCPSLRALYLGGNDLRKIDDTISYLIYIFEISDNPNIVLDVSAVCPYIKAGSYNLIYDRTQDIRGCDYLDLEK